MIYDEFKYFSYEASCYARDFIHSVVLGNIPTKGADNDHCQNTLKFKILKLLKPGKTDLSRDQTVAKLLKNIYCIKINNEKVSSLNIKYFF